MDFGIMKRILMGVALLTTTFLAACGQSGYTVANQVLQQAGISVLAQANVSTQSALSLLG